MRDAAWWRSIARAVRWHRRRLAAVAAALAVGATIIAVRPAADPSVPVWVAVEELPSGIILTEEHLTSAAWPPDAVPARVITDPADVIGRPVAAPITQGSPLTEVSVISARVTEPDAVLLPITLADPTMLAVLQVGDRVDILINGPEGPVVIARRVRVAALPHHGESGGGMFDTSGGSSPLLVEVPESESASVAGAAQSPVSLLLR